MGMTVQQLPPPLEHIITAQPGITDPADTTTYVCGCRRYPHDRIWVLCEHHTGTVRQSGRMLDR